MRAFYFALVLCLGTTVLADDRGVQLLLPSRRLEATSTFEVRFPSEMVPADQIGKSAPASPLVFSPGVEGQFTWLSTRSGTFGPKGILPLGTKYQISLRPGLKDASGRDIKSSLRESVETPPLRVKGTSALGGSDQENATATPRYLILFNANVDAAACAKFIRFVDVTGTKIEARVEGDDPKDRDRAFPVYVSDDRSLAAWGEKPEVPEPEQEFTERENDKPHLLRKNVLLVTST